jgi:hypothetical protein
MFNKIILSAIVFCTILVSATTVNAVRYYINDYALDIMWKHEGNYLNVWGGISGNHPCKKLKLSVTFENTQDDSTRYFSTYIKNYRPMGRNNFKDKVYAPEYNRSFHVKKGHWVVTEYNIKSLK